MNEPLYAFDARVASEHIDELGHVNHKVYFAWAEDAGIGHWNAITTPDVRARFVWVASRIEADFKRESLLGETLRVETWVGAPKGARFDRFVRISGPAGDVRAEVKTTWALIDAQTRRPARISGDLAALFVKV